MALRRVAQAHPCPPAEETSEVLGSCERPVLPGRGHLERVSLAEVGELPGDPLAQRERHAKVEMDRDSGDFKVYELKIPEEIEAQLLVDPTGDQEPTVDPETGELREPPEPELDMEKLKEFEDQIEIEDVTPHDFGRIAAQTAKQVILQRIREAERDMMFEEYRDRYAVEVSSPGQDRPLTKPQHYTRFLGRRARVRMRDAEGLGSLTGELVGASDNEVTIAAGEGIVTIPYDQIARSNLIPGD